MPAFGPGTEENAGIKPATTHVPAGRPSKVRSGKSGGTMKSFGKCYVLIFPALLLAATLSADTLILRDGRRIEGQLISVQNGMVEFGAAGAFVGGGGVLRFDRNAVA